MIVKMCDMIMGAGKAQELDALVLCEHGYKRMGDIRVGDRAFGEDGRLHPIIGVYPQGVKRIFRVSFSDGTYTQCCEDHLWAYQEPQDREKGVFRTKTLKEIGKMPLYKDADTGERVWQVSIPITKPVNFSKKDLLIDPYMLGILLGGEWNNGVSAGIARAKQGVIERHRIDLRKDGFCFGDPVCGDAPCPILGGERNDENRICAYLRQYELWEECSNGIFVPREYLHSSVHDREELLRGLLDAGGGIDGGCIFFSTGSVKLTRDVVYLAQSLGGVASISQSVVQYACESYRVTMDLPMDVAWFSSQKRREKQAVYVCNSQPCRTIREIVYLYDAECQCIMLDSDSHLYLTNDFIVTHNTESAITQMNRDVDNRYIFITPYLDEVKRIKTSCRERCFRDPINKGDGKLDDLHRLLRAGDNIVSTHALFKQYNETTKDLIRNGNYKLIMDEVSEVVSVLNVAKDDIKMLLRDEKMSVRDDGYVQWNDEGYDGEFGYLKAHIMTGHVVIYGEEALLWEFPVEIFTAFQDVTILTYMHDAQIMKYYFDMHNIAIKRIGTMFDHGEYHFCDYIGPPAYVYTLPDRIHILEDKKLNDVGESYTSLSSSWYKSVIKERKSPQLKRLKNNLTNVFINRFSSPGERNLWTTFADYRGAMKGKGYTKGFLAYNIRATNEYRERKYLAYCVNIFYNPFLKNYFLHRGVRIREERYALSEMIQWIWRSSIRDGGEIWIYIPSRRMRELLKNWLDSLSSQQSNGIY